MNKKLWMRIALVAALCMALILACAVASADSSVIVGNSNEPHEVTVGIGSADENVAASAATLRLKRGQVLDIWCWYDGSGYYNMQNGKELGYVTYTTYGGDKIKVTKGSSFIGLSGYYWDWTWYVKQNNTSAKVQKAQIKITDRRGTVATYNINLAPMPLMTYIVRDGASTALSFRKLKGIDGYQVKRATYWNEGSWYYGTANDLVTINKKLSKSKTTYVDYAPVGYYYDYCVVPYKKLGSKTRVSPAFNLFTVFPDNTLNEFTYN